jgi:hypothetical protein
MEKTKFSCPMCSQMLYAIPGTRLNPKDGVTLNCENLSCPAQQVQGHGKNEKDAFEVITQKFAPRGEDKNKPKKDK